MVRLASVMIQPVGTSESSYQVAAHNYTKDDKAFWPRFNLFSVFFAVLNRLLIANLDDCCINNDAFKRCTRAFKIVRCEMKNWIRV